MMRILATAIFAATATFGGHTATAATSPAYSDLVVFGDSLSDPGNAIPGFTFTNGQTYAGQLGATSFMAGGANFAFGGATAVSNGGTPDFAEQRDFFASVNPTLGDDPLTIVFFGGNDLLNAASPAAIGDAINEIASGIGDLATRFGLTRFVVPGLPDLGRIPRTIGSPIESVVATTATKIFNQLLEGQVALLDQTVLDVTFFDTFSVFNDILDDPARFGFDPTQTASTCLRGAISCDGYVFWDDIHPTAAVHSIVASSIAAAVAPAPVPLPAAAWFLLTALGGLGALGWRRRTTA